MRIEKINSTDYKIYMCLNVTNEDEIVKFVKEKLKSMQKRLHLKGFYKVFVFYKYFCVLLEIKKIDDSFYDNTLDLKIITNNDMNLYFKTKDYFVIDGLNNISYIDDTFYVLVDDDFDKIYEKVEFGEFVFKKGMMEKNFFL